ncbi:hypothetical protein ATE84_3977 [Aquimarina sp. MAR_2010_214]|uniref:hypothetical protein n=1 Tax=Aquimarina sp. MAR_2010_214 TaxID=1250026 RepID=UPI000C6FF3CF|nr:hypothetical protein [Aquimarina sp. MAR_2010_214]PKV51877.1 hypothetical protein ATE84_3977 [Aquimarina sp. MAR_2010_214]
MKQDIFIPTQFPLQEELLDLLKKLLTLHSVYVIGYNKEKKQQNVYLLPQSVISQKVVTYTLLIITYKPISKRLRDFMDDLYNKMQKRCKVYAITYTLSKVKKRLNYGDNFLSNNIFQTPCIYKEDDCLSKFSNYALLFHQNVYDRIQETWTNRMDRAEYLLAIIDNIEPKEDSISRLSILHHALEQVSMALLFVFWEFKPQHYSLSYLLHLCSQFSQLPQTIFPKATYGLHRIYYMLCNAHHIIRFKVQNEFSNEDTDKAYNRCEWFYDEAKKLGDAQLEHLKELHCNPSNQY